MTVILYRKGAKVIGIQRQMLNLRDIFSPTIHLLIGIYHLIMSLK